MFTNVRSDEALFRGFFNRSKSLRRNEQAKSYFASDPIYSAAI